MNHLQFEAKIPAGKITELEERLGDVVESMWWDEEGNTAGILFEEKKKEFQNQIGSFFTEIGMDLPDIHFLEMDDRDWLEEDQQQLQPIEVAEFFLFPPHYDGEFPQGKTPFKIDSPHAFGSGHHETTKSCLLALHELSNNFKISNALDVA